MNLIEKVKPELAIELLKDGIKYRDRDIKLLREIAKEFIEYLEEDDQPHLVEWYKDKLKDMDI
jgi:hypothetical protein